MRYILFKTKEGGLKCFPFDRSDPQLPKVLKMEYRELSEQEAFEIAGERKHHLGDRFTVITGSEVSTAVVSYEHVPDRTYWMNGEEHTLVHPATLPEGAALEKPSDISAQEERALRDELLSLSDWAVLPDAPLTDAQKQEWQAYRQALRDIPQQSGFPEFVIVPEAPVKVVG